MLLVVLVFCGWGKGNLGFWNLREYRAERGQEMMKGGGEFRGHEAVM